MARPTGFLARALRAIPEAFKQSSFRKQGYQKKLLSYSRFDSYKLNGEDSQLHWEAVTHRSHRHVKLLQATSWGLVLIIGFSSAAGLEPSCCRPSATASPLRAACVFPEGP